MDSYEPKWWHFVTPVVVILVLWVFFSAFAIVEPGQKGVVTNWGKIDSEVRGEGLHWLVPFQQKLVQVSGQVLKSDISASAASKDLQEISVELAVNWHLVPEKIADTYKRTGGVSQILDNIIRPRVSEEVKAATAGYNAEELITKRSDLKIAIESKLAASLSEYDVVLDNLSIVNIDFSAEFNKAIEAKQVAEQQAKQAEYGAKKAAQDAQALVNYAKGQAEAQQLQSSTISASLLQKMWIEKWNGVMPVYSADTMPVPMKGL